MIERLNNCRISAEKNTIESMEENFTEGVKNCLAF